MQRAEGFKRGETVRFYYGSVDWTVMHVIRPDNPGRRWYILESGMTGRRKSAFDDQIRKWIPGER